MPIAKYGNVTRPSLWAMENLVGSESLRLGIPDTILFKDGAPHAWLFTSKIGDVLKKRSLRKSSIKYRFTRLFATNPNNPQQRVATVRFMDGTVRNLGRDAFKEMMAKFPATEPGITSVQCYLQGKGNAGTIYRNFYRVVNDKGLVVTGTNSFTTLAGDQAEIPSIMWSERDIKFEKCNASSINTALDAVTLGIVRYFESEQDKPTRILHIQCDYVVDASGQIWLMWIKDTTAAVGDAAQDLRLANVALEGPRGRGEFLGPQTALAMQRDFGGPPALTKKKHRRSGATTLATDGGGTEKEKMSDVIDRAAEVMELPWGAVGAGGSGGIANILSEAAKRAVDPSSLMTSFSSSALGGARGQSTSATGGSIALSTMTVGVRTGEAWEIKGSDTQAPGDNKRFPSSFACAGDYCAIRVLVRIKSTVVAVISYTILSVYGGARRRRRCEGISSE